MSTELWTTPRDYILLKGQKSPGTAKVSGANAVFDYLIRQLPFATGARMLFKRRDLAKFTVTLRLMTFEDLQELEEWRANTIDLIPGPRRPANAMDIVHPLLAPIGITACVVTSISQLEPEDTGAFVLTISFTEFKGLPQQSMAKVEAAADSPLDPVDQEILTNDKAIAAQLEELSR